MFSTVVWLRGVSDGELEASVFVQFVRCLNSECSRPSQLLVVFVSRMSCVPSDILKRTRSAGRLLTNHNDLATSLLCLCMLHVMRALISIYFGQLRPLWYGSGIDDSYFPFCNVGVNSGDFRPSCGAVAGKQLPCKVGGTIHTQTHTHAPTHTRPNGSRGMHRWPTQVPQTVLARMDVACGH